MRNAIVALAVLAPLTGCIKAPALPAAGSEHVVARINFYESYAPVDYRPVAAPDGYQSAEAYLRERTVFVILIREDGTKRIDQAIVEPLTQARIAGLLEHDYLMFGAKTKDIAVLDDGTEVTRARVAGSDRFQNRPESPLGEFFAAAVKAAVDRAG